MQLKSKLCIEFNINTTKFLDTLASAIPKFAQKLQQLKNTLASALVLFGCDTNQILEKVKECDQTIIKDALELTQDVNNIDSADMIGFLTSQGARVKQFEKFVQNATGFDRFSVNGEWSQLAPSTAKQLFKQVSDLLLIAITYCDEARLSKLHIDTKKITDVCEDLHVDVDHTNRILKELMSGKADSRVTRATRRAESLLEDFVQKYGRAPTTPAEIKTFLVAINE